MDTTGMTSLGSSVFTANAAADAASRGAIGTAEGFAARLARVQSREQNTVQKNDASAAAAAKERETKEREAREREARTAAEQLVAQTFVVPLLKRFRESNNAAPPFAPTTGEKMLRGVTDTTLAENIVHRSNWALVDRLAQRMLNGGKPPSTGAMT
ncbi:MAG: hypothetical protein SFY96_13620 [Planctomycetota bacterium]|nr:hypothetical protein [Planctomycetota bacterium]